MPSHFLRRTLFPLLLARVRIEGLEHLPARGPYLLVANHQSYLDPVELFLPLAQLRNVQPRFLTTDHVWKAFRRLGGGWMLRLLGMIPIDPAKRADSLGPAQAHLLAGGVIAIFPEGKRNKPNVNPDWETILLPGKTGAARLALATGAPVVPVGIIAPRGFTAWQAIRNFLRPGAIMVVRFGPPLHFPRQVAYDRERLRAVTAELMQAIGRLCGKRAVD